MTCLVNGKKYVGQTTYSLRVRFQRHFNNARYPGQKDFYLHRALRKYGKDNFQISLLCSCGNKEELDLMEDLYILLYDTMNSRIGYNRKRGGANGKQSKETRKLASQVRMGKKRTPEQCARIREASLKSDRTLTHPGWHHTEATRKKMSVSQKTRKRGPRDAQTKKKLSDHWKIRGIGSGNSNYHTDLPTQEIGHLYLEGYSLTKLSKRYSVGMDTIKRRVAEAGISLRPAGAPTAQQRLLVSL